MAYRQRQRKAGKIQNNIFALIGSHYVSFNS